MHNDEGREQINYVSVRGQSAEGPGEQVREDRMDIRTRGKLARGVLLARPELPVLGRRMSNPLEKPVYIHSFFFLSPNVCA